jgi:hypothetical protein
MKNESEIVNHPLPRRVILLPAFAAALLVLTSFYYCFAVADRYVLFLYHHDMGPIVPDTSPFSRVTASRYWMAGLVVNGAIMVLYTAVNWLLGRFVQKHRPPKWWRLWGWTALPLLPGIPLITMTVNDPALPFANAVQVTLATVAGLALAFLPGKVAAERPGALFWLGLDGLGLMLVLTALNNLNNLGSWLTRGATWAVWLAAAMLGAGLAILLILTGVQCWRKTAVSPWFVTLLAGFCVAYLFMPLVHYILFTDGYFYISDSDNFFAQTVWIQLFVWLILAAVTVGIVRLRRILAFRQ